MAAAVVVVVGPTTNVSGRRWRLKSKDVSGIVILKWVANGMWNSLCRIYSTVVVVGWRSLEAIAVAESQRMNNANLLISMYFIFLNTNTHHDPFI